MAPSLLRSALTLTAFGSASALTAMPLGGGPDGVTFDGLPAGTILETIFSENGFGPISVFGDDSVVPGQNAAVIFDTANPTGGDFDLGTPNETFGGPGIGVAGEAGSPFQNDTFLGNVVILAEDLIDADNDGLVDDPDDADVPGATLEFGFPGPVLIQGLTILDVEEDESSATVTLYDANDVIIEELVIPNPGDNGVINATGNTSGVIRMVVTLNGSGAFDNILFTVQDDCNGNLIPDDQDILNGTSEDCDGNGIPDECEPDCDADGVIDACEEDCNENGTPDDCETFDDCNENDIPDECDINNGTSQDCNVNGTPDECEPDCNGNGIPDDCETFDDCNNNGTPDECEPDCNENGVPDDCDVANGTSPDFNENGTPDECELCDPDDLSIEGTWKLNNGPRNPNAAVTFNRFRPINGRLTLDFEDPASCVWMVTTDGGRVCIFGEAMRVTPNGPTGEMAYIEFCYEEMNPFTTECGSIGRREQAANPGMQVGTFVGTVTWLNTGEVVEYNAKSVADGTFMQLDAKNAENCEFLGSGWLTQTNDGPSTGDWFFGIPCE